MAAKEWMYIGEVAERTGLTERTLRFYEEHALISPPRTESGRRVYGSAELTTLHHITVLKRAGFSLSDIKLLLSAPTFDAKEIIAAQIAALEAERSAIDKALGGLKRVKAALAAGATLDAESLCELIHQGERQMPNETWKEYWEKHCTPEENERWMAAKLEAAQGDPDGYLKKWRDLAHEIEQALPLDPASESAQRFLARWNALLTPFVAALDDQMKAEAATLVAKTADGSLEPPLSREAFDFIELARQASKLRNA
ncbi:MAG TPA: MerR family transcriptional regulator [Gammaproteobacteria bacterium]